MKTPCIFFCAFFCCIGMLLNAQVEIDKSIELTGTAGERYIGNLEAPASGTHAANKDYVDAAVSASGGGGLPTIGNGSAPTMMSVTSSTNLSLLGCINYCRNLVESGYNDWRVPTNFEVYYLLSDDALYSAIPNPTENQYFYAINTYGAGSSSSVGRTYFNLSTLDHGYDNPTALNFRARCVR